MERLLWTPDQIADEQIIAALRKRPYDRSAREAADRLEELLRRATR